MLDRVGYRTTARIPTSWKDTLVEPPRIEVPQLPQSTPALALLPNSSTSERKHALSDEALSDNGEEEPSAPPPKKKRYIFILF
jgi:hypothetical protein